MNKFIRNRITPLFLALIVVLAGFGGCSQIEQVSDIVDRVTAEIPTADTTYTSLFEITKAMVLAMSEGKTELTLNVTGIDTGEEGDGQDDSRESLRNVGTNMSSFWGRAVEYKIEVEFDDLEGVVPNDTADVQTITSTFELSDNYYVYKYLKEGESIPEDRTHAQEIANALPAIAAEIFPSPDASDYEKTLAAHDWLVANLEYDDALPDNGPENSSYGAIVTKRTMCRGYAEALELLLKCYTNIEVTQIVGDGKTTNLSAPTEDELDENVNADGADAVSEEDLSEDDTDLTVGESPGDEDAPVSEEDWVGHAWNVVKMDGVWYQVDATFDDGALPGMISHFFFGQTDAVMQDSHRWEAEYFPSSIGVDFLYYRMEGLFADDWEDFELIVTGILTESAPDYLEVAGKGVEIDQNNIQFVYKVRSEIEEIRWGYQTWGDIIVQPMEFVYGS